MADRVQQVRLAEAGVAVDEQRIVVFRRLLRDVAAGGAGEFVRAALDERLEGVFVLVVLLDLFPLFLFDRGDELVGDARAEHALHGVLQIIGKAALDRRLVKFVRRLDDRDALFKIERDWLELAEKSFIAHVGDMLSAVFADQVPCFKKRFHFPVFPFSRVLGIPARRSAGAARFPCGKQGKTAVLLHFDDKILIYSVA